jgi:uncharacterized membrane protein
VDRPAHIRYNDGALGGRLEKRASTARDRSVNHMTHLPRLRDIRRFLPFLAGLALLAGGCVVGPNDNSGPSLRASFTFNPASPAEGQSIQFTDTSTGGPTSWAWDFGDGGTSTAQNPGHAFATSGSRTVTLTVMNNSGSSSADRTVTVGASALTASFTFSPSLPAPG